MAIQTVFQRYELKYLLTQERKEAVLRDMEPYPGHQSDKWKRRCGLIIRSPGFSCCRQFQWRFPMPR